jgi:hypothetical protein
MAILVAMYFIFTDSYKSYSTNNGLLTLLTFGLSAWVGCAYFLYQNGRHGLANTMLWIPAIPILGYGLMILLFIIFRPDMK